jgi:hypothetical protein
MPAPVPANPQLVEKIQRLVASTSISRIARRLRLADATVARLAGGLPVAEGTALIATLRLAELGEIDPLRPGGIT